jgi:hypothetical protein
MIRARQATDGNLIRRMRFVCWLTKPTDAHLECKILITFLREQWIRQRSSLLCYIACIVRHAIKFHLHCCDSLFYGLLFGYFCVIEAEKDFLANELDRRRFRL